jgi:hypothetical protein
LDVIVVATAGEAVTALPADYEPNKVLALIIGTSGEWRVTEISTDLGTYQRIIGSFVAIYYPDRHWHLYCDERTAWDEPTNVPENKLATELAVWGDPSFKRTIRGTAVAVGTGRQGQDLSVPADVMGRIEHRTRT